MDGQTDDGLYKRNGGRLSDDKDVGRACQGERVMQGGLRLGTLAGIEIRIHYTWLFAFVLIADTAELT